MIFKFKTILNEEVNSKREKKIKLDVNNIRKKSAEKQKKEQDIEYNNNTCKNKNINSDNKLFKSEKNYNNVSSTIIKKGSSTTKNKIKNENKSQDFKGLRNNDNFKYSINQMKDYLNFGTSSKEKINSKSNKNINNKSIIKGSNSKIKMNNQNLNCNGKK